MRDAQPAPRGRKLRDRSRSPSQTTPARDPDRPRARPLHERCQHRPRLQIVFADVSRAQRLALRRRRSRVCTITPRPARAAQRTLHWKSPSAPRSDRARHADRPARPHALRRPHRAVASSGRSPLPSAESSPPAQTRPAAFAPSPAGPSARCGSGISVLEGRTTSAGIRASRAAIASASANP